MSMIGAIALLSAFVARITHLNTTFQPVASARAQENSHANHSSEMTVEPLVDGSVNPELVPDDTAIRTLMRTLRIPLNPDAAALKEVSARIARANLSDADIEVVVRELGIFDMQAKEQETRIEAVRPSERADRAAIARYVEEQEKLRSIMADQYQQILTSLSPEGAVKLQDHLSHVKSRIKIYPVPELPASIN
jgi:hypothetical protein